MAGTAGCRTGQPIYDSTPGGPADAGHDRGDSSAPAKGANRWRAGASTAVSLEGGRRHSATTNVTGGFSIPVPPGKYRLEVSLRAGERLLRSPGTIDINESDLDANLEVVISQ